MRPNGSFLPIARLVLAVVLGGLACASRTSPGGPTSAAVVQAQIEEIIRIENARLAAGVRKDTAAVSAATADDYIQIDTDGRVLDKSSTMRRISSSFAQLTANPVDDIVVHMHGNTAILTGRATPNGSIGGKEVGAPVRYSRVYVKRDGRWQVVLFQQTRMVVDK